MSVKDKTKIRLSGVNEQVHTALDKGGVADQIGQENICSNITEALARAEEIINKKC